MSFLPPVPTFERSQATIGLDFTPRPPVGNTTKAPVVFAGNHFDQASSWRVDQRRSNPHRTVGLQIFVDGACNSFHTVQSDITDKGQQKLLDPCGDFTLGDVVTRFDVTTAMPDDFARTPLCVDHCPDRERSGDDVTVN